MNGYTAPTMSESIGTDAPPETPEASKAPEGAQTEVATPRTAVPDVAGASVAKPSGGEPRIIALMNQKGGVGKTTTTVNLGAGLARAGHRVLMIDLDPQAHLTLHLGIDPATLDATMYDLLTDGHFAAERVVRHVSDSLSVLPADVNLAGVEAELADRVITGTAQNVLKNKVAPLLDRGSGVGYRVSQDGEPAPILHPDTRHPTPDTRPYDFVLIDCPPSLGLLTINALVMAREVIVPMQAHFLALQGLGKLFETITMVRQGINPKLRVAGVVLCMHERQTILAGEVIADVTKFLDEARGTDLPWSDARVFDPPIRRNIKLAESPSFGQSIFDYDAACHGAADYAQLAASVAAHRVAR